MGPWYRRSPYFEATVRAGCKYYDIYNHTFLPGYYKGSQPPGWYFGALHDRLSFANWYALARRLALEVATPVGLPIAAMGLAWSRRPRGSAAPGARAFTLAWGAGAIVYLCVFFKLNQVHNYYQIPFLAPAALLIALGFDHLWSRRWALAPLAAIVALGVLIATSFAVPGRFGWYRVDWLRVEAARGIAAGVPRGDLVITTDFDSRFTDPRLLARADRFGWALKLAAVTPEKVERLRALGAKWVAVVSDPAHPNVEPPAFLSGALASRSLVEHEGLALGTLSLFDLARWRPAPVVGP